MYIYIIYILLEPANIEFQRGSGGRTLGLGVIDKRGQQVTGSNPVTCRRKVFLDFSSSRQPADGRSLIYLTLINIWLGLQDSKYIYVTDPGPRIGSAIPAH
jgi:hypothetical protein